MIISACIQSSTNGIKGKNRKMLNLEISPPQQFIYPNTISDMSRMMFTSIQMYFIHAKNYYHGDSSLIHVRERLQTLFSDA